MRNSFVSSPDLTALTKPEKILACGNVASFLLVIALNALSASRAISGKSIGEISDFYHTKFTPASSAFSIWGLIYFGVAVYMIMLLVPSSGMLGLRSVSSRKTAFLDMGPWFILSCACNIAWILLFCWQTTATTWLSVPFLFGLLACLLVIAHRCEFWNRPRNGLVELFALDFTFSVYAGWATVASIVNVSAALVASGWRGAPWTESGWSCLMIGIAFVINVAYVLRKNNSPYGLVYTWAVFNIAVANPDDVAIRTTAMVLGSLVALVAVGNFVRSVWIKRSKLPEEEQTLDA